MAAVTARASARECTYCPTPGADVCVRMHPASSGAGVSVYAHEACAAERGQAILYRLLPEPEAAR
jgi:hypothetical protein